MWIKIAIYDMIYKCPLNNVDVFKKLDFVQNGLICVIFSKYSIVYIFNLKRKFSLNTIFINIC